MRRSTVRYVVALLVVAALPRTAASQANREAADQPTTPPAGQAAGAATGQQPELRVCADPDNLPFSNEKREGFENKIAELIAKDWGATVSYTWWPQRRGYIRNTLRARLCDVVIGIPRGFDPVAETTPYYRSTYYFVTRKDRNLRIASLDDSTLRRLKVGVNLIGEDYTNPPPAHALGQRGIIVAKGYSTFYNEQNRPHDIIDAVVKGDIDVAVVWGPLAGYFAARSPVPLTLTPLPDSVDRSSGLPFAFDIAFGVRRSDKELRAKLDETLARRQADIRRILAEYHIPTLAAAASNPAQP